MEKKRVLIADDESVNRDFFEIMLGNLEFLVDKAEDGEKALECVMENNPDIIIIDDMLPVLTGWQVVKTLKKDKNYTDFKDIPIIMLSDMVDPETVVEGFENGVEDYIRKPFSFAVVYARIRAALRNRELMYKKAQAEEAVAMVKSLSNAMLFLAEHLVSPIGSLKSAAEEIEKNGVEAKKCAASVNENIEKIVAAMVSLSAKLTEMKKPEGELGDPYLDLIDLEERYKTHLEKIQLRK